MGLLNWITGTSTAEKVIETVSSKIDAAAYTEQERAEAHARYQEWLLRYMEATAPQNVARRLVALIIVALWALLIIAAVVAKGAGGDAYSAFLLQVMAEHVREAFLMIMGFYYLAHVVRSAKQ